MKYLFFKGNKRSGTSILCKLLNLHPEVFISHESDIVWYCLHGHSPYEMDDSTGINETHARLSKLGVGFRLLEEGLLHLLKFGTNRVAANPWKKPSVIGDKKPNQHTEKLVNDYLQDSKIDCSYVHITRHPFDFISSVSRIEGDVSCWGETPQELFETWCRFERAALEESRFNTYRLRFEDFVEKPWFYLQEIWRLVGLEVPEDLLGEKTFGVKRGGMSKNSFGNKYSLSASNWQLEILDLYGYKI